MAHPHQYHGRRGGSSQFGDTSFTKLFVGGLAWETKREGLRLYFEQFGEILEAVVITDKITGRSKGYGFVTFRDAEAARRACANPNPVIDGRRTNCNLASLRPQASLQQPPPPFPHGSLPPAFSHLLPYTAYQQPTAYPGYPMEYSYPFNPYITPQFASVYGPPNPNIGLTPAFTYPYPFYPSQQQAGYAIQAPQFLAYGNPAGPSAVSAISPNPQFLQLPAHLRPGGPSDQQPPSG